MLQEGNVQTQAINAFLNRRVADSLASLPNSATQVLVFSSDFRDGNLMKTQLTGDQRVNKRSIFIQIYYSAMNIKISLTAVQTQILL